MIVIRGVVRSVVFLLVAARGTAQQPALTPDEVLARVRANISHYRASVPSFSADETVISLIDKNGKIKDRVQIESTFRIRRGPSHLEETREIRTVNGKRPKPQYPYMPYKNGGGFADFTGFLLDKCNVFNVTGPGTVQQGKLVVAFERASHSERSSECPGLPFRGLALIDQKSFEVERLQSEVTDIHLGAIHSGLSDRNTMATTVEFVPVKLDQTTFWLPQHIISTLSDRTKSLTLRYEASYSNYKLFTSTSSVTVLGPPE